MFSDNLDQTSIKRTFRINLLYSYHILIEKGFFLCACEVFGFFLINFVCLFVSFLIFVCVYCVLLFILFGFYSVGGVLFVSFLPPVGKSVSAFVDLQDCS